VKYLGAEKVNPEERIQQEKREKALQDQLETATQKEKDLLE
jgi:hypothetical protein